MKQLPTITSSKLDPSVVIHHNTCVLAEHNLKYLDNQKELIEKGYADCTTSVFFNEYYFGLLQTNFPNIKFSRNAGSCKISFKIPRDRRFTTWRPLERISDYLTQFGFTLGKVDIENGVFSKTIQMEIVERVIPSILKKWKKIIEDIDGLLYEHTPVFQCRQSQYKTQLIRVEQLPNDVSHWLMIHTDRLQRYFIEV